MSLQIRRGTDSQRQTVTFDLGEIVYTTDSKKLYIGDGATPGGNNILSTAVDGNHGITWDNASQTLRFTGTLSGYTTDNLSQGLVNLYYNSARAKADIATMFTASGSSIITGTITATSTPSISFVGNLSTVNGVGILTYVSGTVPQVGMVVAGTGITTGTYIASGSNPNFVLSTVPTTGTSVSISGTVSLVTLGSNAGLVAYTPFVVTGSGGGGLNAGTYYIVNPTAGTNQISLANSLANAEAGIALTNLTSYSPSATNFSAGGTDSGITFSYNSATGTMSVNATGTGLTAVSGDTNPSLGGNLSLNGKNITGTGSISITSGSLTLTNGNATLTQGNLTLSSGTITASGSVSSSAYIGSTVASTIVSQSNNIFPADLYTVTTGSSAGTPTWRMLSARGTVASPTNIQAGDQVGSLGWFGYYNGTWTEAVGLNASFDATANMSLTNPASNFAIGVNNSSNGFYALKFSYLGVLTVPSVTYGLEIPTVNYITVSSTTTYALSATATHNILVVGSTGLTATLTFPSTGLLDGQLLKIVVSTNTVTLALTAGPTLVGTFAGSVTAPTTITYIYRASNTSWYRLS